MALAAALLAGCFTGPVEIDTRDRLDDRDQVQRTGARVALVIGNAEYRSIRRLNNPVRDAESVARVLEKAGFAVRIETDLRRSAFLEALQRFEEASRRTADAAFYYAGHGMEVGGENYLIPVDMPDENSTRAAVELSAVLESMQGERNMLFLDACRTPPGRELGRDSPLSRGLVAVSDEVLAAAASDILISYAAAPKQPASDGEAGSNSPYAAALAEQMVTPGLRLTDLLMRVRNAVMVVTAGEQQPWHSGSLRAPVMIVPAEHKPYQ